MDTEVVVRAQDGDRVAFASLATCSFGRLHRVAQCILRDIDLADDATQQALVDIWMHLPRLRQPERFEAWSYRILVNRCHREARRARRWLPALEREGPEPTDPTDPTSGVEFRDQLERGFRRLSLAQRTVIVLHDYLDLPLEQVADVLGIPVGTAYSRHHRALQALRAALAADERPGTQAPVEQVR